MSRSAAHLSASKLFEVLQQLQKKIVFAESCTGGRIAATMCELPGVSNCLCGSFVVYRNSSKQNWLGIPKEVLDDPEAGPVSRQASELLASASLQATSEADISLAITGDLGPGAPTSTDGIAFLAIALRNGPTFQSTIRVMPKYPDSASLELATNIRCQRLERATQSALEFATEILRSEK